MCPWTTCCVIGKNRKSSTLLLPKDETGSITIRQKEKGFNNIETSRIYRRKKFKATTFVQKVMTTMFLGRKGLLLANFIPKVVTINANHYLKTLHKLREAVHKKHDRMLSRCKTSSTLLKEHVNKSGRWIVKSWAIPYRLDLAACDFHLFMKLKRHFWGKLYLSEEEVKSETIN